MVGGGNKGPQVLYKYFKDLVHECGLKALHRPSKREFSSLNKIWEPIEWFLY
jgi:hypothetical protein